LVKFWVHIDKDEQLNRFEARKENPAKLWKLHDEDWRNREKWDLYEEAAEEMFLRTHTPLHHGLLLREIASAMPGSKQWMW